MEEKLLHAKVTIIILTWNGLEFTQKCLSSLKKNTNLTNCEILVVDNGSTDGTVEYLRSLEWIKIIENETNEGFVQGNNRALRMIDPVSDVLLLNNDIIIEQTDWLFKLQESAYSNESVGVVGCRLRGIKGELQHAGTYIYPETFWGQQIGGNEKDINQYNQVREVQGIVFAVAYIKAKVLKEVGLLDTAFFSYFEDTDYCFRVRQAGYSVICDGRVTLTHYHNASTEVNKVVFNDIFLKSQKVFRNKWKRQLEERYSSILAWHSIINFPTGYAVSSKNIVLALDDLNVDLRYKYVYGHGTPFPVEEPKDSDNYRINVITGRKFIDKIPQVVYAQGDVFKKNSGNYRIGFTMLEVDGLPKEWVQQANAMDEVWVPSQFNVETFRNSGVKKPINVIPLGVDPYYFNPNIKSYRFSNQFTFLSVFEWGERKAPEILLRAFCEEFAQNEPVMLVCKVFNNDASINLKQEIEKMGLPKNHPGIVFLYNHKLASCQMGALYRSADCFVLPTRGEGWGMPILEAMACGLPVIATDWSSQKDFYNELYGFPVRIKGLIPAKAKCPYYEGFKWAEPDLEHLKYQMRYVFEHQEEAYKIGQKAAQYVAENWSWHHAARKIINRIKEIT